jgi:transposase
MKLRKVARDGPLAALTAARPGRPTKSAPAPELVAAQAEIDRLSEAVKELSVENLLLRGKARWG